MIFLQRNNENLQKRIAQAVALTCQVNVLSITKEPRDIATQPAVGAKSLRRSHVTKENYAGHESLSRIGHLHYTTYRTPATTYSSRVREISPPHIFLQRWDSVDCLLLVSHVVSSITDDKVTIKIKILVSPNPKRNVPTLNHFHFRNDSI